MELHHNTPESPSRVARARQIGAAAGVAAGAFAGFNIGNAAGFESDIGGIQTKTSLVVGENTIRYGTDAIRFDSPIPTAGAQIEVVNIRDEDVSNLADLAPYLQDVGAAQEIVVADVATDAFRWTFGGGAIAAAGLRIGQRTSRVQRKTGSVSALAAAVGVASYAPVHQEYADRSWQSVSLFGQDYGAFSVSGPAANEALKEVQETEQYYDELSSRARDEMQRITEEDAQQNNPGSPTMLFMTDHHCNMGQYRVIADIADGLGTTTLLNAGDETTGTPVDSLCLDIRSQRLNGIPNKINILGNHDDDTVKAMYEKRGETVLDTDSTTVNGITVAGVSDPTVTEFGGETWPRSYLSRAGEQHDMVDYLAAAPTDIALVHSPYDAQHALPYATLTLSGHRHTQDGPHKDAAGNWQYIGGSSGGASANRITSFDTLGQDATLLIIYTEGGRITGTRELIMSPNQSITTSEYTPLQDDTSSLPRPNQIK